MESESQHLERQFRQQSVVLKLSIQYFATHLGFTESEVSKYIKSGMPIDSLEAAKTWLQSNGQTKASPWHGVNYSGERNHLNQPHGSGRCTITLSARVLILFFIFDVFNFSDASMRAAVPTRAVGATEKKMASEKQCTQRSRVSCHF